MALVHPGERGLGRVEPALRHPRAVRHHARALVAADLRERRGLAEPDELALDLADRCVLAAPVLLRDDHALVPPPGAAVAVDELVGGRRAPRPGGVVRERRPVALP